MKISSFFFLLFTFLNPFSFKGFSQCLSGNCENGQGEKLYPDGSKFYGYFKNSRKLAGAYLYPNGDLYEGRFVKNLRSGIARYSYAIGDTFTGEYLNDNKYHGLLRYKNGNAYTGFFQDNLPDGFGGMTYPDGRLWEGYWSKGKREFGAYASAGPSDTILLDSVNLSSLPVGKAPRVFAVVVGIADYGNPRANLLYSDDDARWFYTYLNKALGKESKAGNVIMLLNQEAGREQILRALRTTFSQAGPDDFILFYFSGHGNKGLFCPVDYPDKALLHSEIKEIFQSSKAKYRLCIADACFSGSIGNGDEAKDQQALPSSMAELQDARIGVVMSSRQNQMSQELSAFKQGVFSYYLMRGLQGAADFNGDRTITAAEAFLFTKTMVLKKTHGEQIPFIYGKNLDKMPMARIRKRS
jgi:hypothetical protein